jgi:methionyl-tRNA formyltransferase
VVAATGMSGSPHLVFCGTPKFAVPTLEKLVEAGFRVPLVVTQPDRPSGRGMQLALPPVKARALELGLRVIQPEQIRNNQDFRAELQAMAPEAIIVVGYGRIIPRWMIELPRFGNINLHASLLPKYRGAAPVQWAIAMGETTTGVTTMRIDEGLDTGDILMQWETEIAPPDWAETLGARLASRGADLMVETLRGLRAGTITPRSQDHARATLAPILKREDGLIDFSRTAAETLNRLRGFQPWPGAFTSYRGKQFNIWAARLDGIRAAPGELQVAGDRLLMGCGQGTALELLEVQLQGKRRMAARDFIHGYRPRSSEHLGG